MAASDDLLHLFTCACGERLPHRRPLPDWAQGRAYEPHVWSAPEDVRAAFPFKPLAVAPEVGQRCALLVKDKFGVPGPQASVWALYRPPMSAMNDWSDAPDEIARSALVRIDGVVVTAQRERDAEVNVRVAEVLPLTALLTRYSPPTTPAPLPQVLVGTIETDAQHGDWAYRMRQADNICTWVLCHRVGGHWHLLMTGDWSWHSDDVHFGNRVLSADEAAGLGLAMPR
jgi:hypothetical protein